MPGLAITPEEKKLLLQGEGLDPSKYDITDDGNIVQLPSQPVIQDTVDLAKSNANVLGNKPTALESFGRGAAEGALPALAGLGAAAAAATIPVSGGLSALAIPLLAGLAGGGAMAYGQKKVIPQDIQQKLFTRPEDVAEHPVASFAGGIAPNALAFNPVRSLQDIPRLASALRKTPSLLSAGRSALTSAEEAALINAGINTGVATGQEVADQVMGGEFSPGRLAANAASGLLFTRPTAVGKKVFGFQEPPTDRLFSREDALPLKQEQQLPPKTTSEYEAKRTGMVPEGVVITPEGEVIPAGTVRAKSNLAGEKYSTIVGDVTTPSKGAADAAESIKDLTAKESALRQREFDLAKQEVAVKEQELILKEKDILERQARLNQIQEQPTPKVNPQKTNTKRMERINEELAAQPRETEAEYQQRLYEEGKRRQNESAISVKGTPEYQSLEDAEAVRRGFDLKRGVALPHLGELDYSKRTATLGIKAAPDTAGHETIGHGFVGDLLRSSAPRDRELAMRGIRETTGRTDIKTPEDFFKLPQAEQAALEESLAQSLGKDSYERKVSELYGKKRARFKRWYDDVVSHAKVKFNAGSVEDVIRHIGARGKADAPYGTRAELAPRVAGTTVAPTVRQQADDDNTKRFAEVAAAKDADSFRALFKGEALTNEAQRRGLALKSRDELEMAKKLELEAKEEVRELMKSGQYDDAMALAVKPQYYREVIETATGKGGNAESLRKKMGDSYKPKFAEETAPRQQTESALTDDQTNTPEFKKWFGDSKVVDKDGKPLRVYHGTDADFTVFKQAKEGTFGKGIYVTPSPDTASAYSFESANAEKRTSGHNIKPLYINVDNPITATLVPGLDPSVAILKKLGFSHDKAMDIVEKAREEKGNLTGELQSKIKKAGHDGIILHNVDGSIQEIVAFDPRQVKSASGNQGTFDPTNPDIRRQTQSALTEGDETILTRQGRRGLLPVVTPRYDKIAEKHDTPTGRYVADKFNKFESEKDLLAGRVGNKAIAIAKDYTQAEVDRVHEWRHAKTIGEEPAFDLTANEKRMNDEMTAHIKDYVGKLHQDSGMLVQTANGNYRPLKTKDIYEPSMVAPSVTHDYLQGGPDAKKHEDVWVKHAMKHGGYSSEEQARNDWKDYMHAIGHAGATPDVKFGATRKVAGIGLPWELTDKSFTNTWKRYGDRFASDLSFFKNIQNDPKMLKALGLKDQKGTLFRDMPDDVKLKAGDIDDSIGGSEEVKQAMRSVYGLDIPDNPRVMSAARAVGSLVMQTGTALRNLASIPTSVAPYYKANISSALRAVSKMQERAARAFENNAVRASFKDFDAAGNFEGNPVKFINAADKFVNVMRKYSGRDLSDKLEGLFHYSLGEELATQWFALAKTGDVKARQMLRRFGITLEKPVGSYFKRDTTVTQDDIARIAKEFVNAARGTYGASGLPSVALEGNVAPFLALSRWGIEKSNTFKRDVIDPLTKEGDFMPLLKTSLAAVLSGAAIEQLNEALSNKKGSDATVSETIASGDAADMTAKAIGLMQMGAFGGLLGDAAKFASNVASGKQTKFSSPISFPLASAAEDITQKTGYMISAIQGGEDPFEVLASYMKDIVAHNMQNARYVRGYAEPEETARKEKFRDRRVFEELTGGRSGESFVTTNPYENLQAKEFKRTGDMSEAVAMAPELIQDAIAKATDADGNVNPEKLAKVLTGLGSNNYQTFPDMQRNPLAARDYLKHLATTQGDEAAQSRMSDFYIQRAKNKAKSSLIPRL